MTKITNQSIGRKKDREANHIVRIVEKARNDAVQALEKQKRDQNGE